MAASKAERYVLEPGKRAKLVFDGDVAVAGAGTSGAFAAIAAGRMGAKTLLIERFGQLGGNIGPGMIWGGSLDGEAPYTLPGGMAGLAKEFVERLHALLGPTPRNDANLTTAGSYLVQQMMREAKVRLMLSSCAADPIVSAGKVAGLFVETASGRLAVKAHVTVDATGEGMLAARAGAPMIRSTPPRPSFAPIVRPRYLDLKERAYDDTGLVAIIAGIDRPKYEAFTRHKIELGDEAKRWAEANRCASFPPSWMPALRQAAESGEFRPVYQLTPKVRLTAHAGARVTLYGAETGEIRTEVHGAVFHDDWAQMTELDAALRAHAFEYVAFLRRHIPGMEQVYVLAIAPFLGTRGGPHIEAEHTLTIEESIAGARHDDVLYVNIHEAVHGGAKAGYDFPYRALLPKGLDGLLVTGRGAGYIRRGHDPSGVRARPAMMVLGQCTGVAAALAARKGVSPRKLDVRLVQKALVRQGIVLGDAARLKELRLA